MVTHIETADEFVATLAEVELLLAEAEALRSRSDESSERRMAAMNKAALLLLAGKLEVFMESVAEDFVFAVNQLRPRGRHVPERLLIEHSVAAVRVAESQLNQNDIGGLKTLFQRLGRLWCDLDICDSLSVSCKFNYGRHGEEEVSRLFRRIGVEDVFTSVSVLADEESYGDVPPAPLDMKGEINSLIHIRNNILHQDASPTLTTESVRRRTDILRRFARELVKILNVVVKRVADEHQAASTSHGS